jgi:hypothetical protein
MPDTSGAADDVTALRTENGRLREANDRLRVLLEDKDARITELEERIARLERLISRNSGNSSIIPPTSNQGRARPAASKTQQNISGRLRSENTTRARYAIRGYASTAVKHGIAVFIAIRDALAGNPWTAASPGPTTRRWR